GEVGGEGRAGVALRNLGASGGTSIFTGAEKSLDMLDGALARHRAVVMITDGDTVEKDGNLDEAIKTLAARLEKIGATLHIVAVGDDPNREMLARLHNETGATVTYASERLLVLPAILESELRKHKNVIRKEGRVAAIKPHSITAGIDPLQLPAFGDYYQAGPLRKNAGGVALLETSEGDVLLAVRRSGLGRVAYVNSSLWAACVGGGRGGQLAEKVMNWVLAGSRAGSASASIENGRTVLWFRADGELDGSLRASFAKFSHRAPTGTHPFYFELNPDAPGLWRGETFAPEPGLWRADVRDGEAGQVLASAPLLVEKREEYLSFGADGRKLSAIALAGGGSLVQSFKQYVPWENIPVSGSDVGSANIYLTAAGMIFLLLALAINAMK
ncbi:MAG: VWA domain-containing protein, partial [Planctomycetes bacterium]|nr:VWA domain-containing protein [Planctomycetota bacterium]